MAVCTAQHEQNKKKILLFFIFKGLQIHDTFESRN